MEIARGNLYRLSQPAIPSQIGPVRKRKTMSSRQTIPAVSVALMRGDRILLVKRGQAPSRGHYAFPGGRVEPGETEEQAARRELFEETGLEAAHIVPLRAYMIDAERDGHEITYRLQVFRVTTVAASRAPTATPMRPPFSRWPRWRPCPSRPR